MSGSGPSPNLIGLYCFLILILTDILIPVYFPNVYPANANARLRSRLDSPVCRRYRRRHEHFCHVPFHGQVGYCCNSRIHHLVDSCVCRICVYLCFSWVAKSFALARTCSLDSLFLHQTLRHLAKHPIVNPVCEVHRLLYCVRYGDDSMIYLFFPGQPYTGNEARTQIDHPSIDSRHVGVRVEHGNNIGEGKKNPLPKVDSDSAPLFFKGFVSTGHIRYSHHSHSKQFA